MSQVIIFTNDNGAVTTVYPTGELPIQVVLAKDLPFGKKGFIVDFQTLPMQHLDLYDAWEQVEGVVSINLEKAKQITKTRLRQERAPLLANQDVLYMRAIESGQETSGIVAEKQRLRDITSLADICLTVDELKALHC